MAARPQHPATGDATLAVHIFMQGVPIGCCVNTFFFLGRIHLSPLSTTELYFSLIGSPRRFCAWTSLNSSTKTKGRFSTTGILCKWLSTGCCRAKSKYFVLEQGWSINLFHVNAPGIWIVPQWEARARQNCQQDLLPVCTCTM